MAAFDLGPDLGPDILGVDPNAGMLCDGIACLDTHLFNPGVLVIAARLSVGTVLVEVACPAIRLAVNSRVVNAHCDTSLFERLTKRSKRYALN